MVVRFDGYLSFTSAQTVEGAAIRFLDVGSNHCCRSQIAEFLVIAQNTVAFVFARQHLDPWLGFSPLKRESEHPARHFQNSVDAADLQFDGPETLNEVRDRVGSDRVQFRLSPAARIPSDV